MVAGARITTSLRRSEEHVAARAATCRYGSDDRKRRPLGVMNAWTRTLAPRPARAGRTMPKRHRQDARCWVAGAATSWTRLHGAGGRTVTRRLARSSRARRFSPELRIR